MDSVWSAKLALAQHLNNFWVEHVHALTQMRWNWPLAELWVHLKQQIEGEPRPKGHSEVKCTAIQDPLRMSGSIQVQQEQQQRRNLETQYESSYHQSSLSSFSQQSYVAHMSSMG